MIDKILSYNFQFQMIIQEFPIINELKNIPQNSKYHGEGNVYIHTANVCREILSFPEFKLLTEKEQFILYLAALFHDIGKLTCTVIENGNIVSPRHGIRGSKIFRELSYKEYSNKYEISYDFRESISRLIKYHSLPFHFENRENPDQTLLKVSEGTDMRLLYLLSKADILGRKCDDKNALLNDLEYFKEYCIELGCFDSKRIYKNFYTRFRYLNSKKGSNIHYNDELFDPSLFQVIIMCGLPLSGKDTFIENNLSNLPMISLDDIREEFKISPKQGSGKVAAIARERAKEYLRKHVSFVWNGTNIMEETRKKLCDLFTAYNAQVKFIYIEIPYKKLLSRNKKRNRTIEPKILNNMIHKMDMIEPYEGFSVEYHINDNV